MSESSVAGNGRPARESATEAVRSLLIRRAAEAELDTGDRAAIADLVERLVEEEAPLLALDERKRLIGEVLAGAVGLGPLEPLLSDPEIDEIMVNGHRSVYVEREGRIERTGIHFESEEALLHLIERILAPLGRRLDRSCPLVDARLEDGSRINCVIPPLSLSGPILTIRRFRRHGFSPDELVENGTMPDSLREFLKMCIVGCANIVISGGTGSGKTTTLNALSEYLPARERVVTVEDTAELKLRQPHVVRLESRPANHEGKGEVTIRTLVRNALRMRPDRIVVGEVRGGEALDMLQAMNTGHDGSLTTLHANSAADAIGRIETMALMADVDLPHSAIRRQVASAIDLVVHQSRDRDGLRRISAVSEVEQIEEGATMRDLYLARGNDRRWLRDPSPALAARIEQVGGSTSSITAADT